MMVKFTIPGKPGSKGRPKFSRQGEYVRTYTPEKTVEYENLVRVAWMQAGSPKLNGAIRGDYIAYFPIPKSLSKKKQREMYGKPYLGKPDRDNTEKVIQDALNGCLYDDDAQVYSGWYEKIYVREGEETRVEVTFTEVE